MKNCLYLFVAVLLLSACSSQKNATGTNQPNVASLVENQSFTFQANQVLPQGGRSRMLNETFYTLTVNDKKVVADLPYFGRSFNATMGNDGGVKFTSVDYKYEKTDRSKGGWNIKIIPMDVTDIRDCTLTIFGNGTASLNVNSNNRQPISYQGVVIPVGKK